MLILILIMLIKIRRFTRLKVDIKEDNAYLLKYYFK